MEEEGAGEYTLAEFYKYHFLKKKDLSSYLIKSRVFLYLKMIITQITDWVSIEHPTLD